jgi:hypothetical protein
MTSITSCISPDSYKRSAKMKRSAVHLTVSFRRLSEDNDLLKLQLLATKSKVNKFGDEDRRSRA